MQIDGASMQIRAKQAVACTQDVIDLKEYKAKMVTADGPDSAIQQAK